MKRLLSVTLALTLLGSSVAMAHESGRYSRGGHGYGGHPRSTYIHRNDRGNDAAAAIGVGIVALGLFAALASQNDRYDYDTRYAPAYGPRYGYDPGYAYGGGYGGYYSYRR